MRKITAYNIVHAIGSLPRNVIYNYINPRNTGCIQIIDVIHPAGPIIIKRWDPRLRQTPTAASPVSISAEMIWRIANAFVEGEPINFDRILGASYNTRSALEALMAYTPEFYFCYPGRIEQIDGRVSVKHGHKHLLWLPNEPHQKGVLTYKDVSGMEISEIPMQSVTYDNLVIPKEIAFSQGLDIEVARRHLQIQIALYLIGFQLGYRTWIAQNDKGIIYNNKPLLEQPGMVSSLGDENIMSFPGAEPSARFIDVIWFQNHRYMPAVMEVEHTTGITSGLARMQGLQEQIPSFQTRYVIVAPDEDRDKVIDEINRPQFASLKARYFPYSAVEELYSLCMHRKLHGVSQEFLDCYMEEVFALA